MRKKHQRQETSGAALSDEGYEEEASATETSGAALSDEGDEEEGAPLPKKSHVSESMDTEKEQKLVDFFASLPTRLSRSLRTGDARITC